MIQIPSKKPHLHLFGCQDSSILKIERRLTCSKCHVKFQANFVSDISFSSYFIYHFGPAEGLPVLVGIRWQNVVLGVLHS